jgi:SsrA-binding protein
MKLNALAQNKKAHTRYQILDKIEAGIVLTGSETKSIKNHHTSISDSYAKIIGNQVWLINAHISPYKFSAHNTDPERSRKLLLSRAQINSLIGKTKSGLTLIPLRFYLHHNYIKVEIGIAKGLKIYNKKRLIKEKEMKREAQRELKNY